MTSSPATTRRTRSLMTLRLVLALALTVAVLLTGSVPATAGTATGAGEWQDGRSDSDTIIDRITGSPGTGVYAQTGWLSLTDEVPEVGEVFYVRAYIGLVSQPWSGHVVVLPEILLPRGVEYAEDEASIYWAFNAIDAPQQFSDTPLTYARGRNGGLLVGKPNGDSWVLQQDDVLEVRIPVRALRELKGPATQRPECRSRIQGTAPCPVDESGDHLQVAFTVSGHGGEKHFVTPYVGLFAQAAAPASSTTTATYKEARGVHKAAVAVRADGGRPVAGTVQVRDRGRPVATGTLNARGKVTVTLPRLARGTHKLSVKYAGSPTVSGSTSSTTTLTVR